jgi:hypothetical protein
MNYCDEDFFLEACIAPSRLSVGLEFCAAARRESRYSLLCKENNRVREFI